jgi:hypothetical protein
VVLDDWHVAGTTDRLVNIPGLQLPLIADLKTGAELSYSWQSIAIQLAAYSRANAIYVQGSESDGSGDVRHPMPPVDQERGVIIWLDAGSSRLELFVVDLTAGWTAFEQSMWTRTWRKSVVQRKLVPGQVPAAPSDHDPDLLPLLTASVAAAEARAAEYDPEPLPEPPAALEADRAPQVRAWLQHRIDLIGRAEAKVRDHLTKAWPADMPTLRSTTDHTPAQLTQIDELLSDVEGHWFMPTPPPPFTEAEAVERLLQLFPGTVITTNNQEGTTQP